MNGLLRRVKSLERNAPSCALSVAVVDVIGGVITVSATMSNSAPGNAKNVHKEYRTVDEAQHWIQRYCGKQSAIIILDV